MKPTTTQPLEQIHAVLGPVAHALLDPASPAICRQEQDAYQRVLLELCPAETWHKGSFANGSARPILMARHHQKQLEELHQALTLAITDVVERWWTDEAARLPEKMPLLKEEEELLQAS